MNYGIPCAWRRRVAAAAAAATVAQAVVAAAAPYVILSNGQKQVGRAVRVDDAGSIYLTTDSGVLTFPKGTRVVVDAPVGYDKAVQQVQQKQFDAAIPVLEGIVKEYRLLDWDRRAMAILARAYAGAKDFEKAVTTFEAAFAADPAARDAGENRTLYLESLLGANKSDRLKPMLDDAIARGPRSSAAAAQMMRGRMAFEQGDFDAALSDFLRTADYFRDETNLLAEATFKAGECLSRLGQTAMAIEMFDRVAREYPSSPFAAEAKQKKP